MIYEITVTGEPVPKERPRMARSGHVYTPGKTKHQEAEIALEWVRRYKDLKIDKPVKMECIFYMKKAKACRDDVVQKRPDIDNLLKTVLDGLNDVAYIDDKQIFDVRAVKMWGEPRTVIRLEVHNDDL